MSDLLWRIVAFIASRPIVADRLIGRAMWTPYTHLHGYMRRWWLFNPYKRVGHIEWLPSIRIHHILRTDFARHPHNHPWNARTIILKGWYDETRDDGWHQRNTGDTVRILHSDFHRIENISHGGVWTLFFTWGYQHDWGFRTDDGFVPHEDYLDEN